MLQLIPNFNIRNLELNCQCSEIVTKPLPVFLLGTPSSSHVTVLYCTVPYCTVLYCTETVQKDKKANIQKYRKTKTQKHKKDNKDN